MPSSAPSAPKTAPKTMPKSDVRKHRVMKSELAKTGVETESLFASLALIGVGASVAGAARRRQKN
ncbi:Uncharacterised protein [Arcanobacterium haemolyticum]|uniref:LPXTG cell wall anchor domain-containing protein n=1 Tax=Arcanobacterium haemolyticum TaxID=28264 RepID=UPI000D8232F0|nr:LPXTG cell wall anchor domain-containing protein [Arcanobacterium haemolyticum]SPT75053.1 Uncharacterised protein [Arcanobacterium haemolyticum]